MSMARTKRKVTSEFNPNSMDVVVSNLMGQFKVWQEESVKFREMMETAQGDLRGEVEKLGDRIEGLLKVQIQNNGTRQVYDMRDLLVQHETELYQMRNVRGAVSFLTKNAKMTVGILVLTLLGVYFAGTLGLLPMLMKLL